MVIEGTREAKLALENQVTPQEAYLCPGLLREEDQPDMRDSLNELVESGLTQLYEVSPLVFDKIAYRGDTGGVILVAPYLQNRLADLRFDDPPFILIVEDVEKPGNLGAILRTADAAGVNAVIICSGARSRGTDFHNPNVIRASLGTLFTVPVIEMPAAQAIAWLRKQKIRLLAATPVASLCYTQADMTVPVAVVVGSEAQGLSEEWLTVADDRVAIPMYGAADSLNLAVSSALLLYEVVRQRHLASPEVREKDS